MGGLIKQCIFVFVALHTFTCNANVLFVPQQFPTIRQATLAALQGDTILLANGIYSDSLTMPVDLTFASQFLFTNDTNDINQTIWRALYNRASINPNGHLVSLRGIRYESVEPPPFNCEVLHGPTPSLIVDHCVFSGTFDPRYNISSATLNPSTGGNQFNPVIIITNSVFLGTFTNTTPVLNCQGANSVFIDRCSVSNRSANALLALELFSIGEVTIRRSIFRNTGTGIRAFSSTSVVVDSCRFIGLNQSACTVGANTSSSVITDCDFDSCSAPLPSPDPSYSTIKIVQQNHTLSLIRNTRINVINIPYSQGQNAVVFLQGGSLQIIGCQLTQNTVFCPAISLMPRAGIDETILIDSTRIHDNPRLAVIGTSSQLASRMTVTNSDFDRNTIFAISSGIDSVIAPNCWWGSTSGPNWIGNPNGTGQALSANANPVPWRTSPVFPNTAVREFNTTSNPLQYHMLAPYPNPFNSTVTIPTKLSNGLDVTLRVYNHSGRMVDRISITESTSQLPIVWKPRNLTSGAYFVQLQIGNESVRSVPIIYLK